MIVKHIPARGSGRDSSLARALHARDLLSYMSSPEKPSAYRSYLIDYMTSQKLGEMSNERLLHIGGANFVSDTIEGWQAEMMATAQTAVRSPNPVDHWLLSWAEGENPSAEEVDAAVEMLVREFGLAGHQYVYALHGDTHNRHAHIAINRYNPETERVAAINKGFNHEAGHQAVALIVARFGWKAEKNARYQVEAGVAVPSARTEARREAGEIAPRPAAQAFETRTGYASAQRIAQREALPILRAASSWEALHAGLAARGMAYELTGFNGAVVVVDGQGVKSSDVHRKVGRVALERRLGAFEPPALTVIVAARDPQKDRLPRAFRADEYCAEREAWKVEKARRKAVALRKREREATPANASATLLADLRQEAKERGEARGPRLKAPPRDFESWLYEKKESHFAEWWRHRNRPRTDIRVLSGAVSSKAAIPAEIDGYRGYSCREGVRYQRANEGTAFIDRGRRVDVVPGGEEALLAALKLSLIKYDGRIRVGGSDAFKRRTFDIARRHGFADALTNPEFQLAIARAAAASRAPLEPNAKTVASPPPPSKPRSALIEQAAAAAKEVGRLDQRGSKGPVHSAPRSASHGPRGRGGPDGEGR